MKRTHHALFFSLALSMGVPSAQACVDGSIPLVTVVCDNTQYCFYVDAPCECPGYTLWVLRGTYANPPDDIIVEGHCDDVPGICFKPSDLQPDLYSLQLTHLGCHCYVPMPPAPSGDCQFADEGGCCERFCMCCECCE